MRADATRCAEDERNRRRGPRRGRAATARARASARRRRVDAVASVSDGRLARRSERFRSVKPLAARIDRRAGSRRTSALPARVSAGDGGSASPSDARAVGRARARCSGKRAGAAVAGRCDRASPAARALRRKTRSTKASKSCATCAHRSACATSPVAPRARARAALARRAPPSARGDSWRAPRRASGAPERARLGGPRPRARANQTTAGRGRARSPHRPSATAPAARPPRPAARWPPRAVETAASERRPAPPGWWWRTGLLARSFARSPSRVARRWRRTPPRPRRTTAPRAAGALDTRPASRTPGAKGERSRVGGGAF